MSETVRYTRLLDASHRGQIVKSVGRKSYEYDPSHGWVRSGILLHYFSDTSDTYGMYEDVSEEVALSAIRLAL